MCIHLLVFNNKFINTSILRLHHEPHSQAMVTFLSTHLAGGGTKVQIF